MKASKILLASFSIGLLFACNAQNNNSLSKESTQDMKTDSIKKDFTDSITEVLVFDDGDNGLYSYQLVITGDDIEIVYTYGSHEPIIEKGKIRDNKITINGCDNCYQLDGNSLCIYNPETDGEECYNRNESKSYTINE